MSSREPTDHGPEFWTEVATEYQADHASVILYLFNEPFITDWDNSADFTQWVAKVGTIGDTTNVAASWHACARPSTTII